MKRKLIASLLCIIMIFSFAGCSSRETATENSEETSIAEEEISSNNNFNTEGLPILNEPETFTIAVSKNSLSKNTFAEKECVIQTENETNIKIEWVEIPSSSWTEKTNIMLASGDLPDAFLGSIDIANNLSSLTPLNDAIEKYAPAIHELFEERQDVAKGVTAPDGNIYSLPIGDETYNNKTSDNIWINKKWLDNLELNVPTTTEEFMEVLRAFKTQDPNGNGVADEIPFSFQGTETIGNMFGSFGILDDGNHIIIDDGDAIFTPTDERFYEALQWLHSLNEEGLIDPEAFTMNEEQYNSKFKGQDIVGVILGFDPSEVLGAESLNNFVAVLPLVGPNGDQMWLDTGNINVTGFSITTACENPEALVRWYDYIRSDFEVAMLWNRGPRGEAWDYTDDGKWMILQENCPKDIAYGQWRHTISAASSAPYFFAMEDAGPDAQEFTTDRDILKVATVESYLPYLYKSLPSGIDDSDNARQRSILLTDIDSYIKRFISSSILEGIDEAGWEEHLNTCKTLKTDEYEEFVQNFVDRVS